MTVTIDRSKLGLSDDEDNWQEIIDATNTWNDDFTTEDMNATEVTTLLAAVTRVAATLPQNTALATLVVDLGVELTAKATPPTVTTPTVGTTVTTGLTPATDLTDPDIPDPPPGGPTPSTVVQLPVVAEGIYYDQPPEHTKVVPFLHGKIPLRKKHLVDLAVKAYYGVNREDIVADISQKYAEVNHKEYVEPDGATAIKQSKRPGYKDTDAVISSDGGYPPHWPVVPADNVPVHDQSVIVFRDHGEAGQPFTGIVRFGGRSDAGTPTEPKIILFPTQSEGDYLAGGVRRHPAEGDPDGVLATAEVYGKTPGEYTTHAGLGAQSSHGKLSSHIEDKAKYAALALEGESYQASGMTIGFTVIKGGTSTAHKFSFVSRSSNNPTFALVSPTEEHNLLESGGGTALNLLRDQRRQEFAHLQIEGDGSLTREWADKIISSVEHAVG